MAKDVKQSRDHKKAIKENIAARRAEIARAKCEQKLRAIKAANNLARRRAERGDDAK